MKTALILREAAGRGEPLPILTWPVAKKLGFSVKQLLEDPEKQAATVEYVAKNTVSAAAVMPMDLSVEAEAFGARVRFEENAVPCVIGQLLADPEEYSSLRVPELSEGRLMQFVQAVQVCRGRTGNKPLLAGMIGAFSLAGRLSGISELMYACLDEPEQVYALTDKAADLLIRYGNALREAGADGLILAEPLAGVLSPDMAEEFAGECTKKVITGIKRDDFSVIYHNCGDSAAKMTDRLFQNGADAWHFGNSADMRQILLSAPDTCLCMGNLDPVGAFVNGTPEEMRQKVLELRSSCRKNNFMLSSGCDIPADARWENILAFFSACAEKGN